MSRPSLVVIGDCLLDRDVEGDVDRLSPDAPVPVLDERRLASRPGGAGLAAALASADGWPVTLVTALAEDGAGLELRLLLAEHGVELVDLGLEGATAEKIRLRAGTRSLMRLDRGGASARIGSPDGALGGLLSEAGTVLVADYGRGVAAQEDMLGALGACVGEVPVVWDPHPRGPAPPPGVTIATPNDAETRRLHPEPGGDGLADAAERALALRERWRARSLCVTRGPAGALHVREGRAPLAVPAPSVRGGDPCGAGDRFASRVAERLAEGADTDAAVVDAVECAAAFVAAGGASSVAAGGATDAPSGKRAAGPVGLARSVRAAGGTVVATGGCFDLLHAGHVRTLNAARRLGDCLIVCVNSDSSVARLKGPERPLVTESDRASVLMALGCVDDVLVFDEDTPEQALELLRPHLWVKGADYRGSKLPEEEALHRWGGRAVLVPFVEGRSTTRIIEEAAYRA
jgi:D-beta-D-heptose 7-phosphate kinase / D-beta-D-heptose 1-phosphate adenosyltransferase